MESIARGFLLRPGAGCLRRCGCLWWGHGWPGVPFRRVSSLERPGAASGGRLPRAVAGPWA